MVNKFGFSSIGEGAALPCADGVAFNSDNSTQINVPSGGSEPIPDSQFDINGAPIGLVISAKTTGVNLIDQDNNTITPSGITTNGNKFDIEVPAPTYMTATGGTITTDGDYKIHTFNSSGDFEVLTLGDTPIVEFVLVAGGGSGGYGDTSKSTGGGGAGGLIFVKQELISTTGIKPIVIGVGGASQTSLNQIGISGQNSTFLGYTAIGGGGGSITGGTGGNGGSGGGASYLGGYGLGTMGQGNDGGVYIGANGGCGGGGAGEVGFSGKANNGGNGGDGRQTYVNGSLDYLAGGGGGSGYGTATNLIGLGGKGGGGNSGSSLIAPTNGTPNTGGGGGGGYNINSGAGGSGVCIIRYKYQ